MVADYLRVVCRGCGECLRIFASQWLGFLVFTWGGLLGSFILIKGDNVWGNGWVIG